MVPWATMNLLRRSRELKQFRHPRRQDKPAWRSSIRHDDYVAPLQYSPLTER
jgi:hypothetical protein